MAVLWVAMSKFDEPGCDYSVASRDPPNATSFIPKFPTIPPMNEIGRPTQITKLTRERDIKRDLRETTDNSCIG